MKTKTRASWFAMLILLLMPIWASAAKGGLEQYPYSEGISIVKVPASGMQWPDRGMESVLGSRVIKVIDEERETYGFNMPYEEALAHEYMHSIPERPIDQFKWLHNRAGYTPWFSFNIAEPINYYEEGLAESFRHYVFHPENLDELTRSFMDNFVSGRLLDDKIIAGNLYGRRSDLQSIYEDDYSGGFGDILTLWDWYENYGDKELALAVCGYRADLLTYYRNGLLRPEYGGTLPDTCYGWWERWGRHEYADFVYLQ